MLGVCNGFQILTEAGMLPGALTRNLQPALRVRRLVRQGDGRGPLHARASARSGSCRSRTARGATRPTPTTLRRLEGDGCIGLRYCTPAGAIEPSANPNGSLDGIAGIYGGRSKNVFGLMPHPERMSEALLGGADGRKLFERVLSQTV